MRGVAVVVAMIALVGSGCAAQDDPGLEGEPPATTVASASPESSEPADHGTETFTDEAFAVAVELDDFYFEPTTIKAPGAAVATVELHNEGDASHTFTIDDLDVDEELEPGQTKEIEIELGTETRYEYYCRFHAGAQQMRGAFSLH